MNHKIVKEISDHGLCPDGVHCRADIDCTDCWDHYLSEAEDV